MGDCYMLSFHKIHIEYLNNLDFNTLNFKIIWNLIDWN